MSDDAINMNVIVQALHLLRSGELGGAATTIKAGSVRLNPQKAKSKDEMIGEVRLLHPDAVAVMRDGSVYPYAALMGFQRAEARVVPLVLLNPDELTPEAMEAQIRSPQNWHRIACVLQKYPNSRHEYQQFQKAALRLVGQAGDLSEVQGEARRLIDFMHQEYPPASSDLEGFFDRMYRAKELEDLPAAQMPLVGMVVQWFANRVRKPMGRHADWLQDELRDGCSPELSEQERKRLERNIRERLDQLPPLLLRFMDRAAVPVWLADSIAYYPGTYARGMAHRGHHLVAMLTDESMAVLTEELVHVADVMMNYSKGSDLTLALFDKKWRNYIPDAEKQFLDELLGIYIDKSLLFKRGSHYAVHPKMVGLAKYEAQDSLAREYVANLVHAHTMPLADSRRARLGSVLHKHFPAQFPVDQPYQGEMAALLKQVMPKSVGYYEGFMRHLEELNTQLELGNSPASKTIAPASEGRRGVGG